MNRKLKVKCLVLDHDDTVVKSTPEELLMVDDLKTGYLMAKACGVPFACAGWSDNQIPLIREFMKKNSDYYLETVMALEELLYV